MNKKTNEHDELEMTDKETEGNGSEDAKNSAANEELKECKAQLDEKTKKCDEYLGMLQRTAAEFDNYKKRTAREKEALYTDAVSDVVAAFLPVVDNLERAISASNSEQDMKSFKEGVDMIFRQLKDVMKNLGVEEIQGVGEKFDPNLHNAVMHVSDESSDENTVVEEFQKGYIFKEKVIRHSMVKVAN